MSRAKLNEISDDLRTQRATLAHWRRVMSEYDNDLAKADAAIEAAVAHREKIIANYVRAPHEIRRIEARLGLLARKETEIRTVPKIERLRSIKALIAKLEKEIDNERG